jgi:hypothetical protein
MGDGDSDESTSGGEGDADRPSLEGQMILNSEGEDDDSDGE